LGAITSFGGGERGEEKSEELRGEIKFTTTVMASLLSTEMPIRGGRGGEVRAVQNIRSKNEKGASLIETNRATPSGQKRVKSKPREETLCRERTNCCDSE